jgi:hypothetical protein
MQLLLVVRQGKMLVVVMQLHPMHLQSLGDMCTASMAQRQPGCLCQVSSSSSSQGCLVLRQLLLL